MPDFSLHGTPIFPAAGSSGPSPTTKWTPPSSFSSLLEESECSFPNRVAGGIDDSFHAMFSKIPTDMPSNVHSSINSFLPTSLLIVLIKVTRKEALSLCHV